jgi:hypothetical protein
MSGGGGGGGGRRRRRRRRRRMRMYCSTSKSHYRCHVAWNLILFFPALYFVKYLPY